MSELAALPVVRHGAAAAAAVVALVLLMVFYSVVAGAVERAAQKRNSAFAEPVAMNNVGKTRGPTPSVFARRKVVLARAGD